MNLLSPTVPHKPVAENVRPTRRVPTANWDFRLVATVCVVLGIAQVLPHFFGAPAAADQATFLNYGLKYHQLSHTNITVRHHMAMIASSAFYQYDQALAPNAKVFASGLTGRTNGQRLGLLFFAVYYLFPRQVDVSVGRPPRLTVEGWIDATESYSDEDLAARGYDVCLKFLGGDPGSEQVFILPLTGTAGLRPPPP